MRMSLEFFLNYCKSLQELSVSWLGNPSIQAKEWHNLGPDFNVVEIKIEEFLGSTREFFEYESYGSFAPKSAQTMFSLMKDLEMKVKNFYSSENVFNTDSKEKLFSCKEWIEIQELAKKTEKSITLFIQEVESKW